MNETPEYVRDFVEALRKRADIRRRETCRGADDRLANQLDTAANTIEDLARRLQDAESKR